jgi:AcrR family transcriptional regulator
VRTNRDPGGSRSFTQRKRRDQLVECAIDALVELGFQHTTVAEVARRAGVSKGVVTYHFAAKDDLIRAVVADVFDAIGATLEPRLKAAAPAEVIPEYIRAWAAFYRTNLRHMLAIREIWIGFRDEAGRQVFGRQTVAGELSGIEHVLELGQEQGRLGAFSPRVMAVTIKAALDALIGQLEADPDLDLGAYAEELIALFARATGWDPGAVPARSDASTGERSLDRDSTS